MNWQPITPETELNYIDPYLFRYPKGSGLYVVGGLYHRSDDGTQWILMGDSQWFGDDTAKLSHFTHYCVIIPPKD